MEEKRLVCLEHPTGLVFDAARVVAVEGMHGPYTPGRPREIWGVLVFDAGARIETRLSLLRVCAAIGWDTEPFNHHFPTVPARENALGGQP